ncbi:putative ascorbate-dependent peroxidase [Trypanosoma theileri]|uniref:Cytochrome c peroxidase, mitochondrial n=1 Tax=Trypanosoma theileri TaxID=67003 RepID=A0A1X0P9U7_9TRYP|nr:putative ascorbate-dependent peroxidase [Trypanosoma theileri]XP_028887296.1 putative ascorbate-dependent peroxidase [Trypanosoma theileri]ORC93228.1 putative ascorbate-dependent peroxidase [Trypanosoma theileri]ORC93230.1 putative ascorbate-dependent peroxidase [Trypanosoma theileri]
MFSRVGALLSRRLVVNVATQHRYGRFRFSRVFAFSTAAATTLVGGATVVSCFSVAGRVGSEAAPPFDLKALKEDIEAIVSDDLSKGPLFVRLAWHEAGSWDCKKKDGSPNSASMRFRPECDYSGNAGLDKARKALEPLKQKYPQISYADLWSLAAVVSIETMGGPAVPWRWGRVDAKDGSVCGPDGRLPDGSKTQNHVREVFTRLGFNDDETVALIGAHTCGECHLENSGFKGPWTHDKYGFDNSFFTELFNNEWEINPDVKNLQFMDRATKNLMMLPADMAILLDDKYRAIAKKYAADNELFCASFAKAYQKLLELGTKNLKSVPRE